MGLDAVEILMGWEKAFGVRVADAKAECVRTPRMGVDLMCSKVGAINQPSPYCLTSRAFYRFRSCVVDRCGIPRASLSPRLPMTFAFPDPSDRESWAAVGVALGLPEWPSRLRSGWFSGPTEIPSAMRWIIANRPRAVMDAGEPWSRGHVRSVVRAVITEVIGETEFDDEDDFVHDLGID